MDRPRRTRGFTLVELLIVIRIIGLLITLLMPTITKATQTVRAVRTRATIKQLGIALENFRADFGAFPPSEYVAATDANISTGAAKLVYYLSGPANSGWGFGGGGLMPFGSSTSASVGGATRTYGPYYRTSKEDVRYRTVGSNAYPVGFLDAYKPAGVILYFVSRRSTAGAITYEWKDCNLSGSTTEPPPAYARANFATNAFFEDCVGIKAMVVLPGQPAVARYLRADYMLISPGGDGRYGAVRWREDGTAEPVLRKDGEYDDIANWN